MSIAGKIMMLLSIGQTAFYSTDALSLKNRFLFALLNRTMAPSELCEFLRQDKTNVAHLASALQKNGLIEKEVTRSDKRRVRYRLAEAGKAQIERILAEAETRFKGILDSPEAQEDAKQKLDEMIRLFSFL